MLFLVLAADFNYKLVERTSHALPNINPQIKFLTALLMCPFFICNINTVKHYLSIICLLLLLACSFFSLDFFNPMFYAKIYVHAQYGYGLISILFCFIFYKQLEPSLLKKLLYAVVVINFICIILGMVFDIKVFSTYYFRAGYNGFFKGTSEASYFYMFALVYFFQNRVDKYAKICLLICLISAFLVGSKTLILFVVGMLFILGLKYVIKWMNKTASAGKKFGIILTAFLTMCVIALAVLFVFEGVLTSNSILNQVYVDEGVWTMLFSFRDLHIKEVFQTISQNYSILHVLFGGVFLLPRLTEMGLIDLLLNFGFLGAISYLLILKTYFPKIKESNLKCFLALILMVIFFRGNFLYHPSVVFLSSLVLMLVLNSHTKIKIK